MGVGASDTIQFDTSSITSGGSDPTVINVMDYGAAGDCSTDDLAEINLAIDAADAQGGGTVFFPAGCYQVSDEVVLGNGTSSGASTVDHGVRLVGEGSKVDGNGYTGVGVSEIRYNGTTSNTKAVVALRGPLTGAGISHLFLNADGKAGYAYIVDHHYKGRFDEVTGAEYTKAYVLLTSHASYPSGVGYGNSENIFIQPTGLSPSGTGADGVIVTSRGTSGTSPDSCRNHFIGGTIFYSGASGTAGFRMGYADNNTVKGTLPLPVGGSSGGKDYVFEQVSGATSFPKENLFLNVSGHRGISGTSGTTGNAFLNLSLDDGMPLPAVDNVYVTTNLGKEYLGSSRLWKEGQQTSTSMTGPVSTNATVSTIMTQSLTVKAGARIKITAVGRTAKGTSGSGYVYIQHNGTTITGTLDQTDANGYYKPFAKSDIIIDGLSAGTHTITVKHHSGDSNLTYFADGYLRVVEMQ